MATRQLKIRYLKSYDFKNTFATGVYGGISPTGLIHANFYIERTVLPDSQTVEVDEKGTVLGKPIDHKDGDIMRELQTGVFIDVNTAQLIISWLESKIKEFEAMKNIFDDGKN